MLGLVYRVRFRSTPSLKGYLVIDLQPRPAEARTQEDPEKVDLNRLILLADIAHKYECSSLEEWATDIIRIHWSSAFGHDERPLLADQDIWTLGVLEQLLVLLIKTESDAQYKKQVEAQWLSSAFAESETMSDLRSALDFTDSISRT